MVLDMQAVVLAAGASSRFWPLNTRHKSLLRIGDRSLLGHTLAGLQRAGIDDAVIVQQPDDAVADEVTVPDGLTVSFVEQSAPKGMGHAVQQARGHVDDRFVVTSPYRYDIDMLLSQMEGAAETHDGVVVGTETDHPERYGMLSLNDDTGTATGVVEKPVPAEAPSSYRIVSTYLLNDTFFTHLDAVEQHEYSFEDALDRYMGDQSVGFVELDTAPQSLKYPWNAIPIAADILGQQEQRIADTADVAGSATVDGPVVIADNATVYEHAVLRGPCYIGEDAVIGNNAVVRAGTHVGEDSTVGANAEIRGSILQEGFSCHSGFIGDSVIGRDVAIGAGTVTANRTVRNTAGDRDTISVYVREKETTVDTERTRLGAIIGDGVDIGTQANLMPGVCIGPGAFVGPSTFVAEHVAPETRYYTRFDTVERER